MSCCRKNKYPSMSSMAKDLSNSVVTALRHAVRSGELLTSEQDVRKRIDLCNKCDYKSGMRCLKCGCFISLKTAVLTAECPIKKW